MAAEKTEQRFASDRITKLFLYAFDNPKPHFLQSEGPYLEVSPALPTDHLWVSYWALLLMFTLLLSNASATRTEFSEKLEVKKNFRWESCPFVEGFVRSKYFSSNLRVKKFTFNYMILS